jgi:hypothetical protein
MLTLSFFTCSQISKWNQLWSLKCVLPTPSIDLERASSSEKTAIELQEVSEYVPRIDALSIGEHFTAAATIVPVQNSCVNDRTMGFHPRIVPVVMVIVVGVTVVVEDTLVVAPPHVVLAATVAPGPNAKSAAKSATPP